MSQIWLISDTHFWHDNIYTFTGADGRRIRERFANAVEGDGHMIQRWHDLVKAQDHIYHLGDVCMNRENHGAEWFVKLIKGLPGHKRLILGNHDHLKMKWYIEAGFQKIRSASLVEGMLLSHYPLHQASLTFKVKGNIHGHIHQHPDVSPQHLNVSVERTNYEPIPIEEAARQLAVKLRTASKLDTGGVEITGE